MDDNKTSESYFFAVPQAKTTLGAPALSSASLASTSDTVVPVFGENVTRLLAWREVSPAVKRPLRQLWGNAARWSISCSRLRREVTSTKHALLSWLEAESLRHCVAKYCPLQPAPRSTIAAAFSPVGSILASTHGDHTVKIICCKTGHSLKTLCGHRRTPWVVRFHPRNSNIVASGSLDSDVKLWDANTAECITSHDFYRPIASIAFHAQGDLLAVASGHKLYIWQFNRKEEGASPTLVLRTRRSLRAVHFHPHAAPLLLTAEVNDLDASDCPMTLATSPGYLHCSRPAIFFTPVHSPSSYRQPGNGPNLNPQPYLPVPTWFWPAAWVSDSEIGAVQSENMFPEFPGLPHGSLVAAENITSHLINEAVEFTGSISEVAPMDISATQLQANAASINALYPTSSANVESSLGNSFESGVDMLLRAAEGEAASADIGNSSLTRAGTYLGVQQQMPRNRFAEPCNAVPDNSSAAMVTQTETPGWELPFLQGWIMGQSQAGLVQSALHAGGVAQPGMLVVPTIPSESRGTTQQQHQNIDASLASATIAAGAAAARIAARSGSSRGVRQRSGLNPASSPITEAAAAQAAMAAAELPCTVKLKIWPHDIKCPTAVLNQGTCRLTIPHAVLCSEMGAHFSPCGRFLAACVACMLAPAETDSATQSRSTLNDIQNTSSLATSPTRHPIAAQQVIYELRIYSLEDATFGQVLASRAIRAAHCLTSIQFSPTSEHILLAYGRRHNSLLRSIVVNGNATVPIFTILEVYRVSDMKLVKALPSAEDEVNVACFHPIVGEGLVYGTKEGKLRMLQYDRSVEANPSKILDEPMLEVG